MYDDDMLSALIIALVIFAKSAITLTNIQIMIGLLAVILPGIFWAYKKLSANIKEEFVDAENKGHVIENISNMQKVMKELSTKLVEHMESEDILAQQIIQMGDTLLDKIAQLGDGIAESNMQMIRAVMHTSDVPVNLAKVWKDGTYEYVWANQAYLDLVGYTLQEFQAPGAVFLTIDKMERDIVRETGESVVKRKENYDGTFNLVHAKTQQPLGEYHLIGYYIGNPHGDPYFYLSTLLRAEEE